MLQDPALCETSRSWQPLWGDHPPFGAWEALRAIGEAISHPAQTPSLAGGTAGLALLHAYLEKGAPGEGHGTRAEALIERTVAQVGEQVLGPGFYGGFSGVAWAIDHLMPDQADWNEEIDEILLAHLDVPRWNEVYDLVSGLVGYGVYALERPDQSGRRAIALRVLDHLEALKVPLGEGWAWATMPGLLPAWQRERSPQGYYNLGLAHGVPAVPALLGHFFSGGLERERCRVLAEGSVKWLLAQRGQEAEGFSFPSVCNIGVATPGGPSRLAWCYGDLGISLALMVAARSFDEPVWEEAALDVARRAAARPLPGGAKDAGLCHGFAGNGHLFNRIWQATGEACFAEAARRWFEEALRIRVPGIGVAGYQAWKPRMDAGEGADPWQADPGLLEGAAGIGLALAAALHPVRPRWDRMLLVDIPDEKQSSDRR